MLHFLVLGAALFGLFSMVDKKDAEAPAKIVVSASRVATLADGFARTWRRPPTEQELQGLVEDYIRDEVFYREGRAAGLDRDDVVIRRRVRQKMEFLAEDMAAVEPSDEQLAAYLASNPERFRTEDRLTFRHVFLKRNATRRAQWTATPSRSRRHSPRTSAPVDTAAIGDPFLLGEEFRQMSQSDVARTFGEGFAKQLSAVEPGRWQGPDPVELRSAFRLRRRTSEGRPAAARRCPGGRAARVAERTPDRGRAEALSHAAGPLPDRGGDAAQGRSIRNHAMRRLAILLGVLGCAARAFSAVGRSSAGLSGAAPDGVRHLQPAVQDSRAGR